MSVQPTVLMTGASGLVGSRFIEIFGETYRIANLDLTTGVDITKKDSIAAFLDAHPGDVMIHLAAYTNTVEAMKQQGDKSGLCYTVNVGGTENIAQECNKRGMYLIHISTDFVFDGTKEGLYTEQDPRNPLDWYGETKAIAEEVVEQSGVAYAIMRIAYPYRANFAAKPDLIVKIRTGLELGTLPPQFGDSTITPTFVDDIARAFDALIRTHKQGIYHVTGTTALSPYELAQKVADVYGFDRALVKQGSLTEYMTQSTRPYARHMAIDNSKAARELGLHLATIDVGLEEIKKQQGAQ